MKKAKRLTAKPRAQVGALAVRRAETGYEVLLVTTRSTGRWTIPKGWPMKGRKAHDAATIEAWEEAGVLGRARKRSVGSYLYWKRMEDHFLLCRVKLYPVSVKEEVHAWPEQMERQRFWFAAQVAAELVEEPGLKKVLAALDGE